MKKNDKKERFTPGPWIVLHETNVLSPCDGYVARVYNSPLGPIANRYNATLIAAAPEMYALLERINDMLILDEEDELKYEINSLLAKARGEAKP